MNYTKIMYFDRKIAEVMSRAEANMIFLWFCKLILGDCCQLQLPCMRERQKDLNHLFIRNAVLKAAVLRAPVFMGGKR